MGENDDVLSVLWERGVCGRDIYPGTRQDLSRAGTNRNRQAQLEAGGSPATCPANR